VVFPAASFDAVATLAAVSDENCTLLHGVPTMFISQLEHPDFHKYDLSTLRTGLMSGAPCPEELMNRVMEKMHMKGICIAYGMTETSPVSFLTSVKDTVERRVRTVGQVQPHIQVKVVNSKGHIVPVNTPGELFVKG